MQVQLHKILYKLTQFRDTIPGRRVAWYIVEHHGSVWLWLGSLLSTWLTGGAGLQVSADDHLS